MESLNAVKTNSLIAIELSQLQKQLRQVSENRELRDGEFAGALKPQTAISEILRVIPSSPTDIQPMLDAHTDSLGSTIPVKVRTDVCRDRVTIENYVRRHIADGRRNHAEKNSCFCAGQLSSNNLPIS